MLKHIVLLSAFAVGCSGDTPPPSPDAAKQPDGGSSGPAAFGGACTMVSNTNTAECMSGVCTDAFDQIGHPVCSQQCTPGDNSTCPAGSQGMKCNMQGYCRP